MNVRPAAGFPARPGGWAFSPAAGQTDRGKPGTDRHLAVDVRSTPLGIVLTGANTYDCTQLATTLDVISPVGSGRTVARVSSADHPGRVVN